MITDVSHITFVVRDLDKTTRLFKEVLGAEEVYDSGDKLHSLYRERFFLIGGQWIAAMEDENILQRTYHHVAFRIADEDVDGYLQRIRSLQLDLKPPRERVEGEGYSIYFYDYDNNLFELHTGTQQDRLDSYRKLDGE